MKNKIAWGILTFWVLVVLGVIVYATGWNALVAVFGVIIFWASVYWALDNL